MPRKPRLAALAATAAILVAGCGGSSSPTRSPLVAQADPICKQISVERTAANRELQKVGSSTTKQLQVLARVAPGVAADEQRAVARLRTLKAPSSLAGDWQVLLGGMGELADDAAQIGLDAKAKNLKGVQSLTSNGRAVRQRLTAIADRDGFVYCGRTS
jgi:hypothetical protein